MEREIFISGIGGQGIQLAARTLALAGIAERRDVLVFGTYGGSMRGGPTDATVVIGSGPLLTPPIVDQASYLLLMHHHSWAELKPKLRHDAVILVDTSVFRGELEFPGGTVAELAASDIATHMGMGRSATMLALGAFAALTGIVGLESLLEAAGQVLPSYRAKHADANAAALQAGYRALRERASA